MKTTAIFEHFIGDARMDIRIDFERMFSESSFSGPYDNEWEFIEGSCVHELHGEIWERMKAKKQQEIIQKALHYV